MYSSASFSSLCIQSSSSTKLLYNKHPFRFSSFRDNKRSFRGPFLPLFAASTAVRNLELSWSSSDTNAPDEYNGWAVPEPPVEEAKTNNKKGLPTFAIIGIGASVAALLGIIAYATLLRKGFEFRISGPFNALHERLMPKATGDKDSESQRVASDELDNPEVSEESMETSSVTVDEDHEGEVSHGTEKGHFARIIISYAVDSTQQEALSMLKKLKIVEDDVKADELCTRREYARWLVRVNSQLERNRKRRVVPPVALSGSTTTAFEDVSIADPDFEFIQCLAEAGIVPSKLSHGYSNDQEVNFFPERFVSRQDLICWKAKLEYEVMPGIDQEVSRKNICFLDVRDIGSEALVDLFVDILADENSILRRVFGQGKRFQPNKPTTKAQAAVALTSGRTMELINAELSRLAVEAASRLSAMEEIKSEILERGILTKYWQTKLEDERNRGLKVEMDYLSSLSDLEQENIILENARADLMRQEAAMECQKQLLSSLKDEVKEMSERLEIEKAKNMDEQLELQNSLRDVRIKYEGLLDAKSILESEIEALRILRSWIEDEARKSQKRAKVLEEAGRRWRWDEQSQRN